MPQREALLYPEESPERIEERRALDGPGNDCVAPCPSAEVQVVVPTAVDDHDDRDAATQFVPLQTQTALFPAHVGEEKVQEDDIGHGFTRKIQDLPTAIDSYE